MSTMPVIFGFVFGIISLIVLILFGACCVKYLLKKK